MTTTKMKLQDRVVQYISLFNEEFKFFVLMINIYFNK